MAVVVVLAMTTTVVVVVVLKRVWLARSICKHEWLYIR